MVTDTFRKVRIIEDLFETGCWVAGVEKEVIVIKVKILLD